MSKYKQPGEQEDLSFLLDLAQTPVLSSFADNWEGGEATEESVFTFIFLN